MSDYWPYIIIGVTTGSIYGLTAVGLVLTFKTSNVFNFAHGAVAVMSSMLFFLFFEAHQWPLELALVDSILVAGYFFGVIMERVTRPLVAANSAYRVVATIGLLLTVNYIAPTAIRIDNRILDLPNDGTGLGRRPLWLPTGSTQIGGIAIGYDQLVVVGAGLVSVIALTILLRRTRLGVQMRAVVDSPDLLDLTGGNPVIVRRASWILGATFGTMSGVLLAPQTGLSFGLLSGLVVQAAGAAAFGAFSSLPLAYVGGLVLGIAQNIAIKELAGSGDTSWTAGLPTALPFIALFVVLLVVPKRRLTEVYRPLPQNIRPDRDWPIWARVGPIAVGVIVLVAIPNFVDFATPWTRFLTYVILFLSMGILVKTSGQISLGHLAFAAVGAVMLHHLAYSAGVPWGLAVVLSALCAVPVGAVVAIPAARLSGVFLALATYAFAIALESLGYKTTGMFGKDVFGVRVPRPGFGSLGTETGYYYVVLGFLALVIIAMAVLMRSRLGRLLRGIAESPIALETQGTSVNTVRVLLFCISAFFAGLSGALYGAAQIFVTGSSGGIGEFAAAQALVVFALVMIAPGPSPTFAFIAAIGYAVLRSDITFSWFSEMNVLAQLFFGSLAIRVAINAYKHQTRAGWMGLLWSRLADRIAPVREVPATDIEVSSAPAPTQLAGRAAVRPEGLQVSGLSVRYGSLLAVDSIDLVAPAGRLTGLVGPNGAGKSTTFDACSGLLRPSAGTVHLHGHDVTGVGSAERARLGLGRTFQRVQLWNALTVRDNVALGREGSMAGANPLRQLRASRAEREEIAAAVAEASAVCGITHLLDTKVAGLTTGQRRLVELARCLAGPYDMLLLDEPSSGLDSQETQRFGELLCQVVAQRGAGILLVEHDMSLVMSVCEHIYVLDVGRLLFEGSPAEVQASELVRAAYLGGALEPSPVPVSP